LLPVSASQDWHYISRCAARFWNYSLGDWLREDRDVQARAIADYLEHNVRESYLGEQRQHYMDGDTASHNSVPRYRI